MKMLEISLSEYKVDTAPDCKLIGKKVDDLIRLHFNGLQVVVRGVASSKHSNKTVDELISIIEQTGTDRYDPKRIGDRYENIDRKHIDFFGVPALVDTKSNIFEHIAYGFYHSAIGIHGEPQRIDIAIIYDATKLEQVLHQYEGRNDIKDDGFAFKDQDKTKALLGIIKIKD